MLRTTLLAFLLVAAIAGGCDSLFEHRHPSDETLERNFQMHEAEFEKLIAMAHEDSKVVRIASDFTWLDTSTAWPRPESELGFSRMRWDEYRNFFRQLGIEKGINRPENSDDAILLMASTIGNVGGGSEKGYAYLVKPPTSVVQALDPPPSVKEYTRVYKKLKGNWYLYYMWAG
jgi:hypothetical protein